MKLRDCVATAAYLVDQTEEYDALVSGKSNFAGMEKTIDFLVKCGNLVVAEIADAYLQLKNKQEIETDSDGFIAFSKFDKRPAYIFSAKLNGRNVYYKEYPDRVELGEKGKIAFEYAYLPGKLELGDEVPFREGKPDGRVIAYGIAAEYYLINGQSDEAVVWDKRYRDGLHNAQLRRSEARVRARSWI